jgi:hypothetical protein
VSIAYFDCFSGAGGDMIVAALLDAGADAEALHSAIAALQLRGYDLEVTRVQRAGLAATRFDVRLHADHAQPHRHLKDILAILEGTTLPPAVRQRAADVFTRLAEAEATVHGTTPDRVHFHEVGAVDAILDVVGALLALDLLGVTRVVCSPLVVGSGTVRCAHGLLPVPAPATALLIHGVPISGSEASGELLTPTAAAILTTIAEGYGSLPPMTIRSVGYGAGARDDPSRPNVLRVLLGDEAPAGGNDLVVLLETNLDDVTPACVAHCMERLLEEGALDAFAIPVHMKKSRVGLLLSVLARPADEERLRRIVFSETGTLGIRRRAVERNTLDRRYEEVATPYGTIRVKVGTAPGVCTAAPEFEDCRRAAKEHGVALRTVMDAARSEWARRPSDPASRA